MQSLITLLAGLLFGIGLILGGMTNPAKVQNFLDLFGRWDPSLAFVMAGAIAITAPGYIWVRQRTTPVFEERFEFPTRTDLDRRLIVGAAIFGVGWGLSGFCPGPALTALPLANTGTIVFAVAMLIGMFLGKFVGRREPNAVPAE